MKYILQSRADVDLLEDKTTESCFNALGGDPNFVSCMLLNSFIIPNHELPTNVPTRRKRSSPIYSLAVTYTATFKVLTMNMTSLMEVRN